MCRDNRYVHTFKAVPLRLVRAVTKTVVLVGMCTYIEVEQDFNFGHSALIWPKTAAAAK